MGGRLTKLSLDMKLADRLGFSHLEAIKRHYGLPAALVTYGNIIAKLYERGLYTYENVLGFRDLLYHLVGPIPEVQELDTYFRRYVLPRVRADLGSSYGYPGCNAMFYVGDRGVQCSRETIPGTLFCPGHQEYPRRLACIDDWSFPSHLPAGPEGPENQRDQREKVNHYAGESPMEITASVQSSFLPFTGYKRSQEVLTNIEGKECTICLEYEKYVLMQPCGCLCLCGNCAAQVKLGTQCPNCKIVTTSVQGVRGI